MLLTDDEIYLIVLMIAILFTILSFTTPVDMGDENAILQFSLILQVIRGMLFILFASISWFVLAIISNTLNNCSGSFGTCFTNSTEQTVTATLVISPFANILEYMFLGFGFISLFVFIVVLIYQGFGRFLWLQVNENGGWFNKKSKRNSSSSREEIASM